MKKLFSIMMFSAVCILTPFFALTGCKDSASDCYDINVRLIGGNTSIYVNTQETYSVYAETTEIIYVYFSNGYDHSNASITVNGEVKEGDVYYSLDNTLVGDSPDFSKNRKLRLVLEDINESQDVKIDVSNCSQVNNFVTLSEDIITGARYAIKKENIQPYKFLTELSSSVVDIYDVPVTGKIEIPYGACFWLLLNHFEEGLSGIDRVYLNGRPYKYGNQDVYYIPSIYSNLEISKKTKNANSTYVIDDNYYNFNTFTILPANDSNYVNFLPWTDVDASETDSSVNVNGNDIKPVLSYNFGYYLYLGDEENPKNDPVLDLNFNDNNGLAETKNYISSKMYIELNVNEHLSFDAFDFFISKDRYGLQSKSVESNIFKVGDKNYLILSKTDIQEFIILKEGHESGVMFLGFSLDENYLKDNMFGVKIEYTHNVDESTKENGTFFSTASSGANCYEGLIQYEQNEEVVYYPKEVAEENKLFLKLGGENEIDCQHYTGATILVKDTEGNILKTINTEFQGDELITNRKTIEIDLTNVEESKIILSITYQIKDSDASMHKLSFEHLNLEEGQKLYVSTNIFVDTPVWTEVNSDTNDLYISADQPIYYYISSQNNIRLTFGINLEELNYCVDNGWVVDIEGNSYLVNDTRGTIIVRYAIVAENLWIDNECLIYVTV